jgi:intein/homing endonuclease
MRYQDFDSMEYTPELASALDIYCLAEDTVIPLVDGTKPNVKQLYEQCRTNFYVCSFDIASKRYVRGKCSRVLKTGTNQIVYRVKFDDGLYVRLTRDHLVLLMDGSYRRVRQLKRGDSVRSVTMVDVGRRVTEIAEDGTCDVYDLQVEKYHNFAIAGSSDTESYVIVHNSDETCCSDDKGRILHVFSDNPRIKSTLDDLFYNILNFEFVGRSWARHLPVKYDTIVPLVDGTTDTIENIAKRWESGEDLRVYSVLDNTHQLTVGKVNWCGKNYTATTIVKITLDDGSVIETAQEHPFVLRDGTTLRADELHPGVSLMPFYTTLSSIDDGDYVNGYEKTYDPSDESYKYTHRIVSDCCSIERTSAKGVVHHKDFNKKNNHPSNLQMMSYVGHRELHAKHCKELLHTPEITKKRLDGIHRYLTSDSRRERLSKEMTGIYSKYFEEYNNSELHKQHDAIRSKKVKEKWQDPEKRKEWSLALSLKFDEKCIDMIVDVLTSVKKYISLERLGEILVKNEEFMSHFKKINPCKGNPDKDYGKSFNSSTMMKSLLRRAGYESYYKLIETRLPSIAETSWYKRAKRRSDKLSGKKPEYMQNGKKNHKVLSVEIVKETCDVFCMEVLGENGEHDRHNFAVCGKKDGDSNRRNGVFVSNCKFGDLMLFIDVSPEYGVVNAFPIPINEIEREEGFDVNDPFAVRFRWLTLGNKPLDNWQVAHFRLLGSDMFLPYGSSVIEPARRIWRQLILCEDAMLVYRVVRAPERRVFYIDVGNLPPEAVPTYIEEAKKQLKTQPVTENNTGRVDIRYSPMSIGEDYYIGVRGSETGTKIDTLAGGQNAAAIEDVNYLQRKLFAALKIPKAYLGYEESLCLEGNTKIKLLDGSTPTVAELTSRKLSGTLDNVLVWSCDEKGRIVPSRLLDAWETKRVDRLLRVTLDDGSSVKCTHNHPFMCRDGSYKRADELQPGQSLMPLYVRDSVSKKNGGTDTLDGYEMVQQNDGSGWQYTHKLVNESVTGGHHEVTKTRVIHHIDYNKKNNNPSNLKEMTWYEHTKFHRDNLSTTLLRPDVIEKREKNRIAALQGPEHRAKKSVQMTAQHADKDSLMSQWVHGDKIHEKMSEVMRQNWQDPEYREKKVAQIREDMKRPDVKAKMSGENHWYSRKYKDYDIEWLVSFCVENNVTTLNQWGKKHPNSVSEICPTGERYVRKLINEHGYKNWKEFYKDRVFPITGVPIKNNHKVASVEEIVLETSIPVYDVEVEGLHNFAVCLSNDNHEESFIFVHNSSKSTLSQEDIRFSRTISIIQKTMVAELNKIAIIHLFSHGFDGEDLLDFTLRFSNPSTIAQQQKLELWRAKFDIASTTPENMLSKAFVRQEIFGLNEEQCKKLDEQRMREAYIESKIEAAGGGEAEGGGGGGGGGASSLFGPPGGGGGGEGPPSPEEPMGGEPSAPSSSSPSPDIEPASAEEEEPPEPEESEDVDDDDDGELLLASDDQGVDRKKPVKISADMTRSQYNQARRSMYKAKRRPNRDDMPDFSKMLSPDKDPYDVEHLHAMGTMSEDAPRACLSPDTIKMLTKMSEALGMGRQQEAGNELLIAESSEDLGSIVIEEEE